MKMVLAIINYDDSQDVISSLMKAGFSITKLATTGGFLKAGNVTILIGLDESKLDECFDIIREHSSSRKQIMPATAELGMGFFPSTPVQVEVSDFSAKPMISTGSPTLITPVSIRPVSTVPRPVIENTSSTGIRKGFSLSRWGSGM